jgi:uncharacterized membrane-anchored protein
MQGLILHKADLYGQAVVWIMSWVPFIYYFPEALKKNDFYLLILVHGLGLMIIGIWQLVSCLLNLLQANDADSRFFRTNLLIGIILGVAFFIIASMGMLKIPLNEKKGYMVYVLAMYFLAIDVLAIRYWRKIYRYYQREQV